MAKTTTQCHRPGLEPRPLDPESSALTMRPSRLYTNCWGQSPNDYSYCLRLGDNSLSNSSIFLFPYHATRNCNKQLQDDISKRFEKAGLSCLDTTFFLDDTWLFQLAFYHAAFPLIVQDEINITSVKISDEHSVLFIWDFPGTEDGHLNSLFRAIDTSVEAITRKTKNRQNFNFAREQDVLQKY